MIKKLRQTCSRLLLTAIFMAGPILSGCQNGNIPGKQIQINIFVDGKTIKEEVGAGTTVQAAIETAGLKLGNLDRVEPAVYSNIDLPIDIKIIRVQEEFDVEEVTIPFERQTTRNESLPEGQTMLIQPGINGIQQITYRKLIEDGVEISRTQIKTTILVESRPEIVMVGVQTPFTSISITGRLAYLSSGNAWVMDDATGNRHPVVTSGDLDGRIFNISPGGNWLLFTRKPKEDTGDTINALWMVNLVTPNAEPVYLRIDNVIHFAGWAPGRGLSFAYSTVEPRSTPPGWQSNNDLQFVTVSETGGLLENREILGTNSGGIYGWWGTSFAWSPAGDQLAYARPDSIGLVDFESGNLQNLMDQIPLQTRSDWAWVPGLGWSADGSVLYTTTHAPSSSFTSDETSPYFDLTAFNLDQMLPIPLVQQAGMFSYPTPSPKMPENQFLLAYLQAVFPEQSETSRYRLMVTDRDGSNSSRVFPAEGQPGIDPQVVSWQPENKDQNSSWIGLVYQGNLWFVNPYTSQALQITGDGSIARIDWK